VNREVRPVSVSCGTRRRRLFAAIGGGLVVLGPAHEAVAQTIATDNTMVTRYEPGSDAAVSPRQTSENPTGISFADCAEDLDLAFTLNLSAAPVGSEIQIWAGTGDCITNAASREPGASGFGRCWQAGPSTAFPVTGGSTATGRLHMRDIVEFIGQSDPPATYTPATSLLACKPASSESVIPLNIVFMFVDPSAGGDAGAATYIGTPAQYTLSAALVGPFEPQELSVQDGGINSGTLDISWVPQLEATIQGYNIYVEDLTAPGAGVVSDGAPTLEMPILCPERFACTPKDSGTRDAALDAALDAATDAGCDAGESDALVAVSDAASLSQLTDAALAAMGCKRGPPFFASGEAGAGTGGSSCVSPVLVNTFTVDGGLGSAATSTGTPEPSGLFDSGFDSGGFDSGASQDTGVVVLSTGTPSTVSETAGISNISGHYLYQYVAGATASNFQITGLTNNHTYAITVAAVDGSGNVGPVAALTCGVPQPVTDFYSAYEQAGGQAGGGYCTIVGAGAPAFGSLFGIGLAGVGVAFTRRRQRRSR
jgi:hypothetical protein